MPDRLRRSNPSGRRASGLPVGTLPALARCALVTMCVALCVAACAPLPPRHAYVWQPSPNFDQRRPNFVIIHDTTAPVILWSFTNLVLVTGTNCSVQMPDVTGTNYIRATDLSSALAISQTPTNNFNLSLGTNTVVITVADASSNTAYSTNIIVVQDQTPPVILLQPQSRTNTVGTTADFSVSATACTPVLFQWFFTNSVLAAGTNSTLILPNVTTGSAGNYFVVASATGGAITSSVVTLTVNPIPPIVNAVAANPDGSFNLNFTGTPGYTFVLEVNENLSSSTGWQTVATNTLGADGVWQFSDGQATNFQQRFYRIRQLP